MTDKYPKKLEISPQNVIHRYSERLLSSMPELIKKMDVPDWKMALDIIRDRDNATSTIKTDLFMDDFTEFLKVMDAKNIPYSLDELSKIGKVVNHAYRNSPVDLEKIIMKNIEEKVDKLPRDNLSHLNDIFLRMYAKSDDYDSSAPAAFKEFSDNVLGIPIEFLPNALKSADKIINHQFGNGNVREKLYERNKLLLEYSRALRRTIDSLGHKFPAWVDRAFEVGHDITSAKEYFVDEHAYFKKDLEEAIGGLPLSKVSGRIQVYSQALTGRQIKIEPLASAKLGCSFKESIFLFPQSVNVGKSDEENFRIYKALASYQAGAFIFGTYDADEKQISQQVMKKLGKKEGLKEFFHSFGNPVFAQRLFEILEFARIDGRLLDKFPGLEREVGVLKSYMSDKGEDSDMSSRLLKRFMKYVCTSGENLENILTGEIGNFARAKIDDLRKSGDNVAHSLNSTFEIYKFLEKKINLAKQQIEDGVINVDLENILQEKRAAGYLIAEAGEVPLTGKKFRYSEWDEGSNSYKEDFVQVIECPYPVVNGVNYADALLQKDYGTIQRLRGIFESLRPQEFERVRRQLSGEVDFDEVVKARGEIAVGITPSDKLFKREYKNRRSVVSLILSENSGSLRRFLDIDKPELKLIDIVKHSQIYFSEALDSIGDPYGLATFSGETERNVSFYLIKDFDQPYDRGVKEVIGSLRPLQQNRDGAGIRHATHLLSGRPEKTKLLFYLMEGLPHDFGYEKKYAVEDTKKAIIEAKSLGCVPIVLAYGLEISDDIREISNHAIYREVSDPRNVPLILPTLYRGIAI
ncbi:MAG: hypothetical protein Q7S74_01140 [Nanoarchaeota archaeon]|nr:hypothetical protein [Nanoarchaeota archaeon]